jgi:hypothetical protein
MLKINDKDESKIKEVIKFAEENEFSLEDLINRSENPDKAPGLDEKHNCFFEGGYRVVYSIEEQMGFKCRHISITKNEDLPSITDAEIIMKAFGMDPDLRASHIYQEKINNGKAINFLQPILEN